VEYLNKLTINIYKDIVRKLLNAESYVNNTSHALKGGKAHLGVQKLSKLFKNDSDHKNCCIVNIICIVVKYTKSLEFDIMIDLFI